MNLSQPVTLPDGSVLQVPVPQPQQTDNFPPTEDEALSAARYGAAVRYPTLLRMLKTGIGPLAGMATMFLLPLVARLFFTDSNFAMWALLSTIGRAGLNFDAGGTTYVNSALPRSTRRGRVVVEGALASMTGTLLVGVVSLAAWGILSSARPIPGWSMAAGVAAIAATVAASAARSATILFANVALVWEKNSFRTAILVGEAALQTAVAIPLFVVLRSAWAFPIAMAAGTALPLAISALATRRWIASVPAPAEPFDDPGLLRRFLVTKTIVPVLTMTLTQADRWVVGLLGGAPVLAAYEVAWRFAMIPKIVVTSVTQVLISDTAKIANKGQEALDRLRRSSFRASAALLAATSVLSCAALAVGTFGPFRLASTAVWPMFAALLVGHAVHGSTAPGVMILNGLGAPAKELPSLFVAVAITISGWIIALLVGDIRIAYLSLAAGLTVGTIYFWRTAPWCQSVPTFVHLGARLGSGVK